MLNQGLAADPVLLYRRATARAVVVLDGVTPEQLSDPTPCSDWTVQDLIDHLTGGTEYLLAALTGREPVARTGTTATDFDQGVTEVLDGLSRPGALDERCLSPLGFEWPISQAVAGTFMDVLVHTFDVARSTGQDERLDDDLVEACAAMFLPDMADRGREAGIVGPAVEVGPHASPQDLLLAAMGRTP